MEEPITKKISETTWLIHGENLRMCPFCGGSQFCNVSSVSAKKIGDIPSYRVLCNTCGGSGPECEDTESAKRAWNKRANKKRKKSDGSI